MIKRKGMDTAYGSTAQQLLKQAKRDDNGKQSLTEKEQRPQTLGGWPRNGSIHARGRGQIEVVCVGKQ